MPAKTPLFAWLDLEMTGLDPAECGILEVALILTTPTLEQVAPPLELVVWQPASVLERMSPFVRQMHTSSGLLAKVERSEVDVADAEREIMSLVTAHAGYREALLAGNSIAQDRRFVRRYMPTFDGYLHYRQIDVSTLKELAWRWSQFRHTKPQAGRHTAMADIKASIAELAAYRQSVWAGGDAQAKPAP